MHPSPERQTSLPVVAGTEASALEHELREAFGDDAHFDALHRTLFATDASIYQVTPLGIAFPRDAAGVAQLVRIARRHGVPLTARGAGTGLAGGAVGRGIIVDMSRHMNRVLALDEAARTVEVEPGVVLDDLNEAAGKFGLMFAPDVATSSRATLGGMIANNSCGARSIVYGRTVDHVLSLTVVLADGSVARFDRRGVDDGGRSARRAAEEVNPRTESLSAGLGAIRDEYHDEIVARFPRVRRSNGGYGLDRLGSPGTPIDATKILCGSEGTLGIVVGATLQLVEMPRARGLVVLEFGSVLDALAVTPAALAHDPSAVELVDRPILDATRGHAVYDPMRHFLRGDPEAILIVEFFASDPGTLRLRLRRWVDDVRSRAEVRHITEVLDAGRQRDVWTIRKAGLGLLMSVPGQEQSNSFVEDTAIDPARLRDYIERFMGILREENTPGAGYYAHAGAGVIHVRPVLNLKRGEDVRMMQRIAERVCDLAIEFGGTITGEHGDGIVRSGLLERLYGPRIIEAFRKVKQLFDPDGLMNPGKIVDPWPMTQQLRHGEHYREHEVRTFFDFSRWNGMAGAAGACTGVGECRKTGRAGGHAVMCPSYMATRNEIDTTRARANALRAALTDNGPLKDLDDPALHDVLDLCLSCKACRTECPTGVDMARLKAEWQAQMVLTRGSSARARFIGGLPARLATASRFPRLANWIGRSSWMRAWMERCYGLDRRLAPPKLAAQTFRQWWRSRETRTAHRNPRGMKPAARGSRGPVVLFVDTWMNYVWPSAGQAAVRLLEAAGYEVQCPRVGCCGRTLISQGLLAEARMRAEMNLRVLREHAARGTTIVGVEPSCILTFVDEYPALISARMARTVAAQVMTLESFLAREVAERPDALRFRPIHSRVLYHAHCHQKALVGVGPAQALLDAAGGGRASVIEAGCCGMAGAFGHCVEHYDVSRAVAEDRLLPAIRSAPDAAIVVSGFSCRQQIEHHAGRVVRHIAEVLADALMDEGEP